MARVSPFLQMLLTKKRPDFAPVSPFPEEDPPPAPGPTIPIRPQPTPIVPAQSIAQQPTVPGAPVLEGFGKVPALNPQPTTGSMPAGLPEPSVPTIPLKPQSRVEGAAEIVRKYDQGLHPDPKTGEWVPHKRNKGLQILEGLGNFAASGIGLNLQGLLHPRGTPEQQARRTLRTEVGLQDQEIQRKGAESNIARDTAYADKLKSDAKRDADAPPDMTPEQKHRWEVLRKALDAHPQPFDDKDPKDVVLRKQLEDAGIPIPASYGKQPKTSPKLAASRTRQTEDGKNIYIDEDGEDVLDKSGNPIIHGLVKPDAASGETQEEADRREAERQSLKTQGDTAKGYADHIDKSLLPPLYKQRGEVKAELDRTDWKKKVADEGETAQSRHEALTAQLTELKTQISGLEKDRNDHNSTAGSKAAEALKFERKPKTAESKPMKPAKDGKYHYTPDQIRAKAETDGVSYDDLLKVLQGNKRVVVDQ